VSTVARSVAISGRPLGLAHRGALRPFDLAPLDPDRFARRPT
jgi:hypothetical protein